MICEKSWSEEKKMNKFVKDTTQKVDRPPIFEALLPANNENKNLWMREKIKCLWNPKKLLLNKKKRTSCVFEK